MGNVRELRAEFTARIDGMTNGLRDMQSQLDSLAGNSGTAARTMSQSFEAAGKKMQAVGANMTKFLTVPLMAAGGTAIKYAIDQEKSFAKVSTLLDKGTVDYTKYKDKIRQYSTEMGVSFDEYSESVYGAISAGVDQSKAVEFTAKAVKLAKGGFTDTATAVDVMTTAINAYGLEASDADMISDQLINTQNLGKTTVNELASSMGAVIPVAKAQNVSFDQLATGYAVLTKNGIATSEAGTYMKSMLGELGSAGTEVDKILREKTGKSFSELQASGMNVGEVLQILQGHAEDSGMKMGDMFGSIEAGSAAMVLAGGGGEEFTEILGTMGDVAGATDDAFNKMQETSGAKLEKAWNSMKNSAASFGDTLLPIVAKGAELAAAFAEKVAGLSAGFKTVAVATGAFLLALGPLIAGIGTFLQMAAPVIGWFTRMGGLAGALKAVFLALTGPIGLTVAAIAGLAGIFVAAYKNSETFRNAVDGIVDKMKYMGDYAKEFVYAIQNLFKADGEKGRRLLKNLGFDEDMVAFMDEIARNISAFKGNVSDTIKGIKLLFQDDGGRGRDLLEQLGFSPAFIARADDIALKLSTFRGNILYAVRGIKALFTGDTVSAQELFSSIGFSDEAIARFQTVADRIIAFKDTVIATFKALFEYLRGDNQAAGDILSKMGLSNDTVAKITSIVEGIKSNLTAAFNAVADFIQGIGSKVINFFKSDGAQILEAAKNVFGFIVDVIKNLGVVAGAVFTGIFKVIDFVMPAILLIVQSIWNNIKGVITGALDVIMGAVKIFSGLFTGDFGKMWEGVKQLFMGAVTFLWNFVQLTFFGKILGGAKAFILAFRSGFVSMWNGIKSIFQGNGTAMVEFLKRGWDEMWTATRTVFTNIRDFISGVLSGLGSIFSGTVALVRGLWAGGIQGLLAITQTTFNAIRLFITTIFQTVTGTISTATAGIANLLQAGWTKAREITATVFGAIRDFFVGIWDKMRSDTSAATGTIGDTIKKGWDAAVATTKNVLSGIVTAVTGYLSDVKKRFTDDFNAVQTVTTTVFNAISSFLSTIWTTIVSTVTTAVRSILDFTRPIWEGIATLTESIFTGISNFFATIWSVISQTFTTILTAIFSIIQEVWTNISNATSEKFNAISTFLSGIWAVIRTMFETVLTAVLNYLSARWTDISNVTTTTFNTISSFLSGIWSTIRTMFETVLTAVLNFLRARWTDVSTSTTNTFNTISSFLSGIWSTIRSVIETALTNIRNFLATTWDAVNTKTTNIFNTIRTFLAGIWENIRSAVTTAATNVRTGIASAWDTALSNTRTAFTNIYNAIRDKFNEIVDAARALPGRIGDGLRAMASSVTSGVNSVVNTMASALERGVNGVIGGINTVLGSLGVSTRIGTISVPRYAFGTGDEHGGHKGGFAVVGDGIGSNAGQELIETPGGASFLSPDKPTIMDLPKGTKVYSATVTRELAEMGHLPHYAFGDALRSAADWVKGKVASGASALLGMVGNPTKMLESAMGIATPSASGFIGGMARGGFNKAKEAGIEYIKQKIKDYLAALAAAAAGGGTNVTSGGGGVFPSPFRLTSPPGMRLNPVTGVMAMHNGWDYGAPAGTPIPAQAAGNVTASGYHSIRGNYVRVRSADGYDRIYQHNTRNSVSVGQQVSRGQTVGTVGATGRSKGSHLHYEILKYAEGGFADHPQLAMLADGGWAESIISHDPAKRVNQRAIWNQTGEMLGFKGEGELKLSREIIAVLERIAEGVETEQDRTVIMNDRVVGQLVSKHVKEAQNLDSRRKNRFGGEY